MSPPLDRHGPRTRRLIPDSSKAQPHWAKGPGLIRKRVWPRQSAVDYEDSRPGGSELRSRRGPGQLPFATTESLADRLREQNTAAQGSVLPGDDREPSAAPIRKS